MDSSSHNHIMLWLLASLAAISSFIGLFISYKILKKFDDFQIATYEVLDLILLIMASFSESLTAMAVVSFIV